MRSVRGRCRRPNGRRGVLGHDDAVLTGIAKPLAPAAEVSVLPHDNAPAVPPADALAAAYRRHGLSVVEARAPAAARRWD